MRELTKFWGFIASGLGIAVVFFAVCHVFLLSPPVGLVLSVEPVFLHLLLGLSLAIVFIDFSPTKRSLGRVAWYDIAFACLSLSICGYFSYHGLDIILKGWMLASPHWGVTVLCVMLVLLVLEALRRTVGLAMFSICLFFLVVPTFASHLPGFLEGQQFSITDTLTFHALSPQSLVGLPLRVVGTLLLGYILFGVVLKNTGGGKFFLEFSIALLGRFRGGAAKVAVVASSLFGSVSGSAIANVVTTGSVTIPAMKRTGFPGHYAAAIEACASTGGLIMPPIMGAVAFIMAEILGISYFKVILAALVPSLLYYIGLFLQIDAFAARQRMPGWEREKIPLLSKVLKEGWFYGFSLVLLVYFLYLGLTAQAPFYAVIFLLVVTMARKETRFGFKSFYEFCLDTARMVGQLTVIIGAVGLVLGSLAVTGIGVTLSGEIVSLAQGNMYLILIFGAVASYILGMGMTTTACYLFLSVTMAPALVAAGLNPLAVHLFVLYWGVLSNITPPVAMAVFPAASIAGEKPLKVGVTGMRLGGILYVVPFVFVLSPALVVHSSPTETLYSISTALPGLALVSTGLGRYLVGVGELALFPAILLIVLGLALALPLGGGVINILSIIGIIITIGVLFLRRK